MLFPTHLAAAALAGRVTRLSTAWLVVGAAAPDLIDKPLGMAGVVDLYHSVGHSLLLAVLAVPLARRSARGAALALGWASHLALDAFHVVVNGRPTDALFLTWPVVVPPAPPAIPPGAFARQYVGTPSFWIEVLVWLALAAVVVRDRRTAAERA